MMNNTRVLAALFTIATLSSCATIPPLPPLLDKAGAGGGYNTACPPTNEQERKLIEISGGLAESPVVSQRLQTRFPTGTDAALLSKYLVDQGFQLAAPCASDASVQRATYFRRGVGLLPYDTSSTIYWKIDAQQRIEWVKGFLFFQGL